MRGLDHYVETTPGRCGRLPRMPHNQIAEETAA
jgi:hypothetical protein